MRITMFWTENDIIDFKERLKKMGKYKRDALALTFFNFACTKNATKKWYEVEIHIKKYKEEK